MDLARLPHVDHADEFDGHSALSLLIGYGWSCR
jgi:hypothetical protein